MITAGKISAGAITAAKISAASIWINNRVVLDVQHPTCEEDKVILKLKGYEQSLVDDHWVLWGKQ